jgi:phospholipid/cholesterol/gamma-HCH transport system substrate-binding protein
METNVNYTLAGLFVVSLFAMVVFGVIWLSADISRGDNTIYEIFMKESVSGLSLDGPVEFNGVNVGTVSKIKISHEDPRLVDIFVRIKSDTPVTVATRAKFAVRALSGVGYILLEDKGTDKRPLEKKKDQHYPVIETVPSILVRLETTLTQLSNSFRELSHSMQSLLDKENLQSVRDILHSTKTLLGNENLLSIKEILQSSKKTFKQFEERTIPLANQAITSLDMVTRDLSFITAEVRENPAVLIRGKAPPTKLGPGEK